mgnify:CR=1 FL=1
MSDPSTVLYQMGEAVAAKVNLGKSELLSGTNTWTGASNTFNSGVSIGDLTALRAATFNDNVTISGNLTVNGTTTALSTTQMEVKDNFIHISKGANSGAYDKDSGFYFERGAGLDPQALIWDESEEEALLLKKKTDEFVRFKWMYSEDDDTYFEMRIVVDELTKDVSLFVVDFAEDDEVDETKMLWENQIDDLKKIIGSV